MLKKTITYTDYNDIERTEDFYFNLSKSELAEMQFGVKGGMSEFIKKIIATQDSQEVLKQFKKLILKAYGEKSDDGVRFIKSHELSEAFAQTEAYNNLFMEMLQSDAAADFIKGIMPKDIQKNFDAGMASIPGAPALSANV